MPARKKSKPNPPRPTSATTTVEVSTRPPSSGASGTPSKTPASVRIEQEHGAPAPEAGPVSSQAEISKSGDDKANEDGKSSLAASTQSVDADMPDADPQPRPTRSWYGSWQRGQVKESPSSKSERPQPSPAAPASTSQKDLNSTPTKRGTASLTAHLSPGASSRSLPLTGMTVLNISSDGSLESKTSQKTASVSETSSQTVKPPSTKHGDNAQQSASASVISVQHRPANTKPGSVPADAASSKSTTALVDSSPDKGAPASAEPAVSKAAATSAGTVAAKATSTAPEPAPPWMSWFGKQRPESQVTEPQQKHTRPLSHREDSKSIAAAPEVSTAVAPPSVKDDAPETQKLSESQQTPSAQPKEDPALRPRSWLGLWSGGKAPETRVEEPRTSTDSVTKDPSQAISPIKETKAEPEKAAAAGTPPKDQKTDVPGSESTSGWAFWSRAPADATKRDFGELAVAGSSSQSRPENAVYSQNGMPKTVAGAIGTKRGRPASLEVADDAQSISSKKSIAVDKRAAELVTGATPPRTPPPRPVSRKEDGGNLLLPLFHQTFPVEPDSPSLLQQIGRYLYYGKPPPPKYPMRLKEPARIKNALAIGIHGYFPTALMQTVLGRPTGTSIKFAEAAANSIHKYAQKHQHAPISVEKIALEGEGKIEERLDLLWKLLLNWIDKIRHADFILIACHSQGVPVAISLAAKLIGFGCVNGARMGICAMAGVNLGPFVDYKSRFIGGSAGELFEFAKHDSPVSKAYETALDTVLRSGAKVIYVGSMDDQLVSLQSSTFGTAEHAGIYRAVWIDGRVHIHDFLTHLVGFALKLRNLGVPDHGLVRELSNPLAGSLVGGEGHSRIYEDDAVYDLAVEFTAATTSLNEGHVKIDKAPSVTSQNPYILPFAMRGLLEEEFVRTELADEAIQLLSQFDDWKPTTKVLRDVKYRLEGVRSKL